LILLVLLIYAESMSIEDPFSNLAVHPRILLFRRVPPKVFRNGLTLRLVWPEHEAKYPYLKQVMTRSLKPIAIIAISSLLLQLLTS
jgi:hypothetical protein